MALRQRGLSPTYVPPISVVLACDKGSYIAGLATYAQGDVDAWLALPIEANKALAAERVLAVFHGRGRVHEDSSMPLISALSPGGIDEGKGMYVENFACRSEGGGDLTAWQ